MDAVVSKSREMIRKGSRSFALASRVFGRPHRRSVRASREPAAGAPLEPMADPPPAE